jgi:hypothetical protein
MDSKTFTIVVIGAAVFAATMHLAEAESARAGQELMASAFGHLTGGTSIAVVVYCATTRDLRVGHVATVTARLLPASLFSIFATLVVLAALSA